MATFLRFGVVGAIGFVVDSAVLYAGLWLGLGLLGGRIASYFVAATATWYLHRRVTFRATVPPSFAEWGRFLVSNALGGLVNVGGYWALVLAFPFCARHPVVAVALGAIAGIAINYTLSRRVVFRQG